MEYSESERTSLAVAAGVVIFSIIAILAYVYTGGGVIFYAVAIITLCLELYMSLRISRDKKTSEGKSQPKSKQKKEKK